MIDDLKSLTHSSVFSIVQILIFMRIAVFHELPEGGALKVINEMSKRLKGEHIVDLYTTQESNKFNYENYYSNTYTYKFVTKKWNGRNWKARIYKDSIELIKLFKLHYRISQDIREKNYDILFVNGSKFIEAPFILLFKNKNKLLFCHNTNYRFIYEPILDTTKDLDLLRKSYEKTNKFARKYLDILNIKSAKKIITGSKFEVEMIKKTYGLKSKSIPYGVDFNFFKPVNTKKEYDVLFIGSSHLLEGYPTLLEVEKLLPKNVKIKKNLGDKKWVVDINELRKLYQNSKIVLSLGHNEPFGLTPLDAMSCEVGVIAVNEGGYKETIKDGVTGYLVPRDPKLISEKIMYLLNHERVLEKMGKNGRRHMIANYNWERNITELNKVFSQMIND